MSFLPSRSFTTETPSSPLSYFKSECHQQLIALQNTLLLEKHNNYVIRFTLSNGSKATGILSYTKTADAPDSYTIILRTFKGSQIHVVPVRSLSRGFFRWLFCRGPSPEVYLRSADPDLMNTCTKWSLTRVSNAGLAHDLVEYSQVEAGVGKKMKIGVMYCAPGQQTEKEMYANRDGSPEWEAFLHFLGDRVPLHGFPGYTGSLDTSHHCFNGTHTVHTEVHGTELAFHVSTLLPFTEGDPQQVERKKHIGNDNLVVVFQQDPATPVNLESFRSQQNHAFFIVTPARPSVSAPSSPQIPARAPDAPDAPESEPLVAEGGSAPPATDGASAAPALALPAASTPGPVEYRVAIAYCSGCGPHSPQLPSPPCFAPEARDLFFEKLISVARATWEAPIFAYKIQRMRDERLSRIARQYAKL